MKDPCFIESFQVRVLQSYERIVADCFFPARHQSRHISQRSLMYILFISGFMCQGGDFTNFNGTGKSNSTILRFIFNFHANVMRLLAC